MGGETCQVNEILKKNNVSVEKIEEYILGYQSDNTKAFLTLINTVIITTLIYGSIFLLPYKIYYPIWIMLRAFLFIRIYIIFHDCTHGSFFSNQTWNW